MTNIHIRFYRCPDCGDMVPKLPVGLCRGGEGFVDKQCASCGSVVFDVPLDDLTEPDRYHLYHLLCDGVSDDG